jgi:hypothetical protein
MLGLVVASGICGLLLGWYFKIYVTLPMVLVLLGPYFLGPGFLLEALRPLAVHQTIPIAERHTNLALGLDVGHRSASV